MELILAVWISVVIAILCVSAVVTVVGQIAMLVGGFFYAICISLDWPIQQLKHLGIGRAYDQHKDTARSIIWMVAVTLTYLSYLLRS